MRTVILGLLCCVTTVWSKNQFDFDYQEIKNTYAKFNAVFLDKSENVYIDLVGDSLVASQHCRESILILTENGGRYSNNRVHAHSFTKIHGIDANTYVPKGNGKYNKVKVTEFNEIDDMSSYVFYDDSKAITFAYPNIIEGAVTSLEYNIKFTDTRFLRTFFFKSYLPVLKSSLTIHVNKNIELDFKKFNIENLEFDYSESERGNYKIYNWKAKNLDAFKSGGERMGITHYSPHVIYYIGNVNVKGETKKQYGSIDDLYRFYFGYIQHVDTSCNETLHVRVKSIVAGVVDEEEKVEKILAWVRSNIKYIAFEQGMRGFIPDHGCDVYDKKYGDCKDMSTLIVTMLHCAGIKAHLAWTGTRHIPYSYEELPLPKTDNHMVAVYMRGDMPIILDGTIAHLNYGYPPYLLQGKEILVSYNADRFEVYEVPVLNADQSKRECVYYVNISGDSIVGSGESKYVGYYQSEIKHALSAVPEKDMKKRLIVQENIGSNKFNISDYSVDLFASNNQSVEVQFQFNVPGYVRSIDDEIFVNLNINRAYGNFNLDTALTDIPLENDFYFDEVYKTAMHIPVGYKVEFMPENKSFESDRFGFKVNYTLNEGVLLQEKHIYFKFLVLEKKEFESWNKMIANLVEAYRESIVLQKI